MKAKIFLISLILGVTLLVVLSSCKKEEPRLVELDASNIMGKLGYVENPLCPATDTILCLTDVQSVYCRIYDSGYCSSLKNLLSCFKGTLVASDEHLSGPYSIEFVPDSFLHIYPMRDGKFISVTDTKKGNILDSISLSVMQKTSSGMTSHDALIYTHPREQLNDETCIYIGDYVTFQGDDHLQPIFITHTVVPSNDSILCFEASRGPILAIPSIKDKTTKF